MISAIEKCSKEKVEISKNHVLQFLDKKLPKSKERKEIRIIGN